ncbi:TniQ family protein [Mycolicibacterium sp.]|uniref:TniQ family protein n=1 Tax=Mycolicibacterium sp. TaxID=2320850 RepID=UPI001A2F9D03|nr:TniQ family protein [Mycolicibacterium sp.]MBJ7337129.1 TniQ family protein [Mycolicibacterium sp.]
MRAERRQLPLQVEPLEGESLESWLEATALAAGLPTGALAAAGGLPTAARPSWRNWLSPTQTLALAAATGLPTSSLQAMTLSHYDGRALSLDPEWHRLDPTFPFGPLSWSRFCPECIRETAGRWQLAWRLGWSFACMHHNCLLVDACPECRDHPIDRALSQCSVSGRVQLRPPIRGGSDRAKLEGAGSRTVPVVDGAGRAALQLTSDAVLETALNQETAKRLGYEIRGSARSALSARLMPRCHL